MASIVMAILKATVGKLLDKGRKMVADRLKEGDVTDEQFRALIVSEIDEIKSKLDGIARANLLASISFFKEGILYLYKVLDLKPREKSDATKHGAEGTDGEDDRSSNLDASTTRVKPASLAKEINSLHLTDINGPSTRALSDAKSRFKDARRKATEGFSNEALSTSDRVLAMQFRVMSTLLEKIDVPADALVACGLCLEELHAVPAIKESFKVQLKKSFKSRFNKSERKEIISSVCRLNRAIFDVSQMVSEDTNLFLWPCIDTGEEIINPLRDYRVAEVLSAYDVEQFCITPLALGHYAYGEEKHKLRLPWIITTNTRGEILVLYLFRGRSQIEVFSSSGEHIKLLSISLPVSMSEFAETAIDTDQGDNIYLIGQSDPKFVSVFVFDKNMTPHETYTLRRMETSYWQVCVVSDNNKLLALTDQSDIQVFDTEKHFLYRFGAGTLNDARDITYVAGRVMVLCCGHDGNYLVHLFNEEGEHLSQFGPAVKELFIPQFIRFHHPGEQVLVLSEAKVTHSPDICTKLLVSLYTIGCVFVRDIQICIPATFSPFEGVKSMAVTKEGRVAICDRKRVLLA